MAARAPAPAAPDVRSDLDALQGAWESVAGPRQARFLVAGRKFSFEFTGGDIYIGTLEVGAAGQMDMHVEEGPADHRGTSPCIYQLDGGVLRWCPGRPRSGKRPAAFPDVDDNRYLSLVFLRAGRAPRR
jgi:uncharacterized protein (TIGR03067 family)